tara:strand:- start:1033 stop:1203 length:171 start_codon:yes stop_codon:yes gene_type:complete
MTKTPEWKTPLYEASISIACMLDNFHEPDVYDDLCHIQTHITKLENILYKATATNE